MVKDIINYQFTNETLLEKALTHPSAAQKPGVHYERLEFLGDAVLDIVISEYLFNQYPDEQEGALAKRRAAMVRGETLAEISEAIGLGDHLKLGKGEKLSGGKTQKTNLANVFEALIGAIYLDGGIEPVKKFVLPLFIPRAEKMMEPPKDAKTALQEWAQGQKKDLPEYVVVNQDGPPHAPLFTVEVRLQGFAPVQAAGTSKRVAEQEAAQQMLNQVL